MISNLSDVNLQVKVRWLTSLKITKDFHIELTACVYLFCSITGYVNLV